jgi:hypothetical protein
LLQTGGVILFDDVGFDLNKEDGVIGGIKKFMDKYNKEYRFILQEYQWMIQKI